GDITLDKIIGGIQPGSLLVILGHPGAGKTTFAAKVLYENIRALAIKTLYISLAETHEKFISNMKRLRIDFKELEHRGFFEFIHVPSIAAEDAIEFIMKTLSEKILSEGTKIAVIDSITPLLNVLGTSRGRAFLHAALYDLINASKGVLILIADLPWGRESVELGGIEFIADAVLVFKTRIERGMLSRYIEIRKFRGAPIPLAEIPFAIIEGEGIRIFPILPTEEIPPLSTEKCYITKCRYLDEAWGGVPEGANISIVYPQNANIPLTIFGLLAKLIIENDLRTAIISFEIPAEGLAQALKAASSIYNLNIEKLEKNIVLEKSFNPTTYSLQELTGLVLSHIERAKAELIIIHGLETLYAIYPKELFMSISYNVAQYLKKLGIIVIKLIEGDVSRVSEIVSYSDIVHSIVYLGDPASGYRIRHIIWKSVPRYLTKALIHDKPIVIDDDKLALCFGEYR
ncbi:MAG TPA: hypothetical protein ENF93_01295, partial [Ignisphaera sp.]|nr:hypothetical protein [Ignisphaera sp.]